MNSRERSCLKIVLKFLLKISSIVLHIVFIVLYVFRVHAMSPSRNSPILAAMSVPKPSFATAAYSRNILDDNRRIGASIRRNITPKLSKGSSSTQGQSSRFRGVSLLRRTGRWHAQINFDGRQIHLGFYSGEDEAAGAYDRAAIIKWSSSNFSHDTGMETSGRPPLPPTTNFHLSKYAGELNILRDIKPTDLISALSEEHTRKNAMMALAKGFDSVSSQLSKPLFATSAATSPAASEDLVPGTPPMAKTLINLRSHASLNQNTKSKFSCCNIHRAKRRKMASPHASAIM